jgi:cell wall-associated NlpC family hydrolase
MSLDRRLNLYRPDLADVALEGQVDAVKFVAGTPAVVSVPVADLRQKPDMHAGIDTQLLFGEAIHVFEQKDGWAWIKADFDDYVGYLPETDIAIPQQKATHWIVQPRTFVYHEPDMKRPIRFSLSMGSRITVAGEAETRGTRYFELATGGAVVQQHCLPISASPDTDYVNIASRLVDAPYLWGGKSAFGLDCSALVQLSMMMTGRSVPRDSDMQASGLGTLISREELIRGDLVFWKGHVGIMEDGETLLHANGHTMSVARENLEAAIARIGWLYGGPTCFRRP